ncbi:MAG: AF1514 family protein [Sulfuritalea sp.]|nr:AF1514 family protein [Sulfuritalea sp.]
MNTEAACLTGAVPGDFALSVAELAPSLPLADYLAAMQLADAEASARLGSHMLLSWYDRDRDFESPQHASECHAPGAMPGYAVYGLHHGATLMVNVEQGRFVFFYLPLE